jgi:two-component system LytT family sensor kinase
MRLRVPWCDVQNRLLLFGFSGLLLALHVDFPYLAVATGFACAVSFYAVETYLYPKLAVAGRWRTSLRGALIFVVGEAVGMLIIGLPLALRHAGPLDSFEAFRSTFGWGGALGVGVGAVGTLLSSFQTLAAKNEEQQRALADTARKSAELRALVARAETTALRAQINPHFLYNALNTLAYLTEEDPPAARRVVEKLARIFRRTLERSSDATTTLAEELEFVADYLGIECERFDDVLSVRSVIDPATLRARVPTMMLQPLAENAVKHGICPVANGGTLTVRTALVRSERGDRVRISLDDDGRGMAATRLAEVVDGAAGVGIANVRARLHLHYGDRATVSIESKLGEGTSVVLEFPYETAAADREAAIA